MMKILIMKLIIYLMIFNKIEFILLKLVKNEFKKR